MLRNYFRSAIRVIKNQKGYSLITLSGLTIGMTCFILISLFVRYEFSFDGFHENSQNIYRVLVDTGEIYRGKSQVAVTPAPLAGAMMAEYPEVLNATMATSQRAVMKYRDVRLAESRVYYADPAFLEIFRFPLVAGNLEVALAEPNSLLLSREMAEKYFGEQDPVGETIQVNQKDFKITGVLENIPGNSHFRFDYLASFSSLVELSSRERVYRWNSWSYYTYVLLHRQTDLLSLEQKLTGLLKKKYDEDATQILRLQPVTDIHLYTQSNFELEKNADIRSIYLLLVIGILILLIACFNTMNLATARSTTRAKEIGMRKVIGARRSQLIRQFLGESVFFSLIALVVSVLLVRLLLPSFRIFIERKLEDVLILDGTLLLALTALAVLIGFISGSYPALILSSFRPSVVLKGARALSSRSSSHFRNVLVICQFAISVALIFCTLVVYRQLHFMQNKELGFVKDHVVTVPNPESGYEAYKNELLQNPHILDAAASDRLPHNITSASSGEWEGYNPDQELIVYRNRVDDDFFRFYNLSIIQGRGFSREFNDEDGRAYILNQAAVKTIGWEDPIGKRFGFSEDEMGAVVGVVKDFHFAPLHLQIAPLALTPNSERNSWLSVRIDPQNIPTTLAFIESEWKRYSPSGEFSLSFLDDRLDRMYRTERKLGETLTYFTFIAIFVACLGLFGLASFTTVQRTKEIGIRKVLGATEWDITLLTTKKFILLVLVSNAIAWPLAYVAINQWLHNFAYTAGIGSWIFIQSAAISLVIALLTVGFQSVKAALANPADSLRYE